MEDVENVFLPKAMYANKPIDFPYLADRASAERIGVSRPGDLTRFDSVARVGLATSTCMFTYVHIEYVISFASMVSRLRLSCLTS